MRSLLTAAAISLAFTLFLTPVFLRLFRKWGWGQVIRTPEDDRQPESRRRSAARPRWAARSSSSARSSAISSARFTGEQPADDLGLLVIWMMVGFGAVGFIDDYMKVRSQRSLGLIGLAQDRRADPRRRAVRRRRAELPEHVGPDARVARTSRSSATSRCCRSWRSVSIIGWILYLDVDLVHRCRDVQQRERHRRSRRARGGRRDLRRRRVQPHRVLAVQPVVRGRGDRAGALRGCYDTRDPFDLAIVSASFVGALVGFLWWNAPKAKVFMGDVGSMAIGGVDRRDGDPHPHRTAAVLVIAGVFVIASGSVILQRLYFKLTRGKRLFLMSPFHHHLEMRGWSEVTIVVRMWIIAGLLAVSGVGLFYVEWLTRVSERLARRADELARRLEGPARRRARAVGDRLLGRRHPRRARRRRARRSPSPPTRSTRGCCR